MPTHATHRFQPRRAVPVAAMLAGLLLAPAVARGLPLDLADATPRDVGVAFERSAGGLLEDLLAPHEAFGPAHHARLTSDGVTATIVLPGAALATELGDLALPGSATDAVLTLDVLTGVVSSATFAFDTPFFLGEPGPWRVEVAADSTRSAGFLPSFRYCEAPPRCTFVDAEGYSPETGRLLAIGTAGADGPGAAFFAVDLEVSELPEPAPLLLLLAGVAGVGARRRAARSLRVLPPCALALAVVACGGPAVEIAEPPAGARLAAPALDVRVLLTPPAASLGELELVLEAGLDAPAGPAPPQDVTALATLAADGTAATLRLEGLPQGRSLLHARRLDPGSGTPVASDARTLDRGGYHGAAGGPFGAGVRYEQVQRPSTLDPATLRALDVAVWYPTADPGAAPSLPVEQDLQAVLDAPPAPGLAALPLVLFSHGNCGWEGQSSFHTADLARAGFVVAAPAHAGNTVGDPDCEDFVPGRIAERPDDVLAVLDALLAWNADPGWPLHGALDPERVAATGFSLGGLTAILAAAFDARFTALLGFAPSGFFLDTLLPLPVPAMTQCGELDTTVPCPAVESNVFDLLDPPRFGVTVVQAGHSNFADRCQTPFVDCLPGDTPLEDLHAAMRRMARGFLGRYLAEDVRWETLLAPAPDVTLVADP